MGRSLVCTSSTVYAGCTCNFNNIVHSPPITFGAGTEGFTEDYAIVELDSSKIEKAFRGNVIDLGTFGSISLRLSSLTAISR